MMIDVLLGYVPFPWMKLRMMDVQYTKTYETIDDMGYNQ